MAVSDALRDMSAAPRDMLANLRDMLATSCDMLATPCNMSAPPHDMFATQNTHGNSRGLDGPSGWEGGTIHEKCIWPRIA